MDFIFWLIVLVFVVLVAKSLQGSGANRGASTRGRSGFPSFNAPSISTFVPIVDKFTSIREVQEALREAGLESSNLIIGVDFTKSNNWTGAKTFGGKCLHTVQPGQMNPYQTAIQIIGETLSVFDDDGMIPAYGFGDASTGDKKVFPFYPDRYCFGFREVLERYEEVTHNVSLSGPTSFAPLIKEAIHLVRGSRAYHILLIVADGQVTNVRENVDAIVEASEYPLSIIMIGVGDGPWDTMEDFDDGLPSRKFDNFQFVNFHEVLTKYDGSPEKFALHALMEIPDQYKFIKQHLLPRS